MMMMFPMIMMMMTILDNHYQEEFEQKTSRWSFTRKIPIQLSKLELNWKFMIKVQNISIQISRLDNFIKYCSWKFKTESPLKLISRHFPQLICDGKPIRDDYRRNVSKVLGDIPKKFSVKNKAEKNCSWPKFRWSCCHFNKICSRWPFFWHCLCAG